MKFSTTALTTSIALSAFSAQWQLAACSLMQEAAAAAAEGGGEHQEGKTGLRTIHNKKVDEEMNDYAEVLMHKKRRLTSKKSTKSPKAASSDFQQVCLNEAFLGTVAGPSTPYIADNSVATLKCFQEVQALPASKGCIKSNKVFWKCLVQETGGAVSLFDTSFAWNNNDGGGLHSFRLLEDAPRGDGALCTNVDANSIGSLFSTLYNFDYGCATSSSDLTTINFEKFSYQYCVNECGIAGSGTPEACGNEFYSNVYTVLPGATTTFYECRFNFVPEEAQGEEGMCYTYMVDLDTPISSNSALGGTNCNSFATLRQAFAAGLVVGSLPGGVPGYGIALNIGQAGGTNNDANLDGCIDDFQITFLDGETYAFDFEPAPSTA